MIDRAALPIPTTSDKAFFAAKAACFRLRRKFIELTHREKVHLHGRGETLHDAPVAARITSPLWNRFGGIKEHALTAGKIENLRLALRHIDGIEVPAGQIFSFWAQIGRASRRRGFVDGRELREGCLIRTAGGGLCQLSNALYEAALEAGFEIIERHAHSRIIPGSRAEASRDAAVFWNYVDLRFRAKHPFRIEARLTHGELRLSIRTLNKDKATAPDDQTERAQANDCTTCGEVTCSRNDPEVPRAPDLDEPTAWLVDASWPEFVTLFQSRVQDHDALFVPQRLRRGARHDWPECVAGSEIHATFPALHRALALRRAPAQGRALQSLFLRFDEAIARHYAKRLSHLHTHAVVSQSLLPHLWRLGVLAGRSFDVLMERAPIAHLQATLDDAAARHPESPTLADFRSPPEIAEAELEALAEAHSLYTPHQALAEFDKARTVLLDWHMPTCLKPAAPRPESRTLLFPASALARKGAYALRDALDGLDVELIVTGKAKEHAGKFWNGTRLRGFEGDPWSQPLAAVVMPAIVEHQPRALLRALALGLPVIATPACGLAPDPKVRRVDPYDTSTLRAAIIDALSPA
jgi:hypothetical protein